MVRHFRVALIQLGKSLPFIVCFIVCISYLENVYALYTNNLIEFDDGVYLCKPLSWAIGNYFEYSIPHLFVLCVLSVAIETCIFNKLACAYLGVNLWEKSYLTIELEPTTIYFICIINIAISFYLTLKGIKILLK